MMDLVLFRQVLCNPFIAKTVYYYVKSLVNARVLSYRHYCKFSMIAKNGDWDLLAHKLRDGGYVCWDLKPDLFKITNLDLFIQCVDRYRKNRSSSFSCQEAMEKCMENANWGAAMYLLNSDEYKERNKLYKKYPMTQGDKQMAARLLEGMCRSGGLPLAREYIAKYMHSFSAECFTKAARSGDVELAKLVFESGKAAYGNLEIHQKENTLVEAASSGNVQVFKYVKQQFESTLTLFSLRKTHFYHYAFVMRLFAASITNYDVYMFLYNSVDLAAALAENNLPQSPPAVEALLKGPPTVAKHILEKGLYKEKDSKAISLAALHNGDFQLYESFKDKVKDPVPARISLSLIKDLNHLDQVMYMVEKLHAPIALVDLERAVASTEVFMYLFSKYVDKFAIYSFNFLLNQIYLANNTEIILYLSQKHPLTDLDLWSNLCHLNPNKTLALLHTLLSIKTPNISDFLSLVKVLQHYSERCTNIEIYSLLLDQITLHTMQAEDTVFFQPCFMAAAKGGRLANIQCLFTSGLRPTNYTELLECAATHGSCAI
ncbi:hypothetical protein CYY_009406, partial [Polysphondylium violaceum]